MNKTKEREEYQRKLNESVNYIGVCYVQNEVNLIRRKLAEALDGSKEREILELMNQWCERIKQRLDEGKLSGKEAHHQINHVIYDDKSKTDIIFPWPNN